jgi:hypothetical protein
MPADLKPERIVKLTSAQVDFEADMLALNFVVGRYVFSGANVSQIICPNQDEMLKHAQSYDDKVNRAWKLWIFTLKPETMSSVLFKEVNTTNKQVTYMFQKNNSTVVKMTVATD